MEDDYKCKQKRKTKRNFNPRPPCGGRRHGVKLNVNQSLFQSTSPVWRTTIFPCRVLPSSRFQSTSPVWRTTLTYPDTVPNQLYFNPRPPCGGRLAFGILLLFVLSFQSTSPVWRTTVYHNNYLRRSIFQSTSPVWRTTGDVNIINNYIAISIHVPRVEDDRLAPD